MTPAQKARRNARARAAHAKARRRGICVDCHERQVQHGRVRCKPCLEAARMACRARVARARAAGLCTTCRKRPEHHSGRCEVCHARHTAHAVATAEARRQSRIRNGDCASCGEPMTGDDYPRCAGCRQANAEKQARRVAERIAAGICRCCGRRHVTAKARQAGGTTCGYCLRKRRARESAA